MEKYSFLAMVMDAMEEHPEWVPDVFEAVLSGSRAAHEEMCRRLRVMRTGIISAMAFVSESNMTDDMRKMTSDAVLQAYAVDGGMKHCSPCEVSALRKIKGDRDAE